MLKLKLNVDLLNKKKGDIVSLKTDKLGNILDSFWAKRLKDSKIDNCVEIYKNTKKIVESKKDGDKK